MAGGGASKSGAPRSARVALHRIVTACSPSGGPPAAIGPGHCDMHARSVALLVLSAALALTATACGGGEGGGDTITADGSSTVGPFVTKAAEDFKAAEDVDVTVGISGTTRIRAFLRRRDRSLQCLAPSTTRSRLCARTRRRVHRIRVATDALTNVVSPENDFAICLTVDQLKAIWGPGSMVSSWSQVDPSFPDVELSLSAPAPLWHVRLLHQRRRTGRRRQPYRLSPSEDDNVICRGLGSPGRLGYLGFRTSSRTRER